MPIGDGGLVSTDQTGRALETLDQLSGKSKRVRLAEKRWRQTRAANSEWRSMAKKFWRAYNGNPFESADEEYMEETERPLVKYNLALGTINAVAGADQAETREAKFEPVDKGVKDAAIGDWSTRLVRRFHRRSHGHSHEYSMFLDKLVTGRGWNRVVVHNRSFPFIPKQEHVDSWKVWPDPAAKDMGLMDMQWLFVEERWPRELVEAQWPARVRELDLPRLSGEGAALGGSDWPVVFVSDDHGPGASAGRTYGTAGEDEPEVMLRILEHQYIANEPWVAFTDPATGEDMEMSNKDFRGDARSGKAGRLQELLEAVDEQGNQTFPNVTYVEFPKDVHRRAYYVIPDSGEGGFVELEDLPLVTKRMTYVCDTGFVERDPDTGRTKHFGLMHVCFDPQRYIVRVLSFLLEMLRRSSAGGVWVKAGALASPGTFLRDYARPGAPILVKDDADIDTAIKERAMQQWPSSTERFFEIIATGLPEITGVTRAFKGTVSEERSQVSLTNQQAQTAAMLNPLLAPLTLARQELAKLWAILIQATVADDSINRVIGEEVIAGLTHEVDPITGDIARQPEFVMDPMTGQPQFDPMSGQPIPNPQAHEPIPIMVPDPKGVADPMTGQPRMIPVTPAIIFRTASILDFDVEVELGMASPNARAQVWRVFMDTNLLPQLQELGIPVHEILPDLIKYLPLPPEEAARLSKKMEAAMRKGGADQVIQMLQKLPPEELSAVYDAMAQITAGGGVPGGQQTPGAPQDMGGGMPPDQMM
jgi:hypothetical protein